MILEILIIIYFCRSKKYADWFNELVKLTTTDQPKDFDKVFNEA